jgi:hypothetical protein
MTCRGTIMHARSTFTRRAAAAALVLAFAAARAIAQQPEQNVEFQSFRLPGWSITPSVALGVVYDSNVALTTPTAEAGDTRGDALFTILPGGSIEYIGRQTNFSAGYRGLLRRYTDVEGLNGFDQRSVVSFRHAATRRLTFFAQNDFADSPTTDEVDLNGVPFRRTGSTNNAFAAGTQFRLAKFTTLDTRYDMTWVDFEREDAGLRGGTIHAIQGHVGHQVSRRLTFGGEYSFRTSSLDQGTREFNFQDAGGTVKLDLAPHMAATAAVGFATMHDRSFDITRSGPYFRLGITRGLESATVGATFERHYAPSFGFGGANNSQELRSYITMPLGRQRFYVLGSGAWRRSIPFEADALELDTFWLRSTIGFAASRWARVEGLYTYTRQDSIVTGGEVDRHRVGVQFVVSQPVRIQ